MSGHSHEHHDHSNCNHDHGAHAPPNKAAAATDELSQRQQLAEKLKKNFAAVQELANEHRKSVQSKTSTEAVQKADVDLLIKEMQLTKAEAETALRANKCDIIATLTSLVNQ